MAAGRGLGEAARVAVDAAAAAGEIEWSRAVVDGSHVQAKKGAPRRGRARSTGAGTGSKHHLLVDGNGTPLAWALTGGNRHDVTQLLPLLDRVPAVRRCRRPAAQATRRARSPTAATTTTSTGGCSATRGITPVIARRNTEHGSGLGTARWVVERTFAWLHQFKRLLVRYERRADMHEAMLALGCCLICFRRLTKLILQ